MIEDSLISGQHPIRSHPPADDTGRAHALPESSLDSDVVTSPQGQPRRDIKHRLSSHWNLFTTRANAPYQAALLRMGFALTFGVFLLREWPNRRVLYGDLSPWNTALLRQQLAQNHAFTLLAWSSGRIWFELIYTAAIVVSILTLLGWRTRTMSVLFMIMVLSIENRDVWLGDGGDNVMQLMAVYLAFTRSGQVWSLDARRKRLSNPTTLASDHTGIVLWILLGALLATAQITGFATPGMLNFGTLASWPPLAGWATVFWAIWAGCGLRHWLRRKKPGKDLELFLEYAGNMLHNCAMLVIAAQVCIIYGTAGWEKIQGALWQHGTAVYFPLHIAYFQAWPFLSNLLTASTTAVFLVTYGTVFAQVLFPFAILNRKAKNTLLAFMFIEHICIAVLLGLPFFSLAMIFSDSVFLPTRFLLWVRSKLTWRISGSGRTLGEENQTLR